MSSDLSRAPIRPDKICLGSYLSNESGGTGPSEMLKLEHAGTLSRPGVTMKWPDRIAQVFRPGGTLVIASALKGRPNWARFVPRISSIRRSCGAVLSATDWVALFLLRPTFPELWRTGRASRGRRFPRPKDLGYDLNRFAVKPRRVSYLTSHKGRCSFAHWSHRITHSAAR